MTLGASCCRSSAVMGADEDAGGTPGRVWAAGQGQAMAPQVSVLRTLQTASLLRILVPCQVRLDPYMQYLLLIMM